MTNPRLIPALLERMPDAPSRWPSLFTPRWSLDCKSELQQHSQKWAGTAPASLWAVLEVLDALAAEPCNLMYSNGGYAHEAGFMCVVTTNLSTGRTVCITAPTRIEACYAALCAVLGVNND